VWCRRILLTSRSMFPREDSMSARTESYFFLASFMLFVSSAWDARRGLLKNNRQIYVPNEAAYLTSLRIGSIDSRLTFIFALSSSDNLRIRFTFIKLSTIFSNTLSNMEMVTMAIEITLARIFWQFLITTIYRRITTIYRKITTQLKIL